jgi:hypothetical protein
MPLNPLSVSDRRLSLWGYLAPLFPLVVLHQIRPGTVTHLSPGEFALLWVVGLLVSYLLIASHEAGHVLFARMFRLPIESVTIGRWFKIGTFSLRGTPVTLRACPSRGSVRIPSGMHRVSPFGHTLFLSGGVLANAILVALLFVIPTPASMESRVDLIFTFSRVSVLSLGICMIVSSLAPLDGDPDSGRLPTDGMLLLRLWRDLKSMPEERQLDSSIRAMHAARASGNLVSAFARAQVLRDRHPDRPEFTRVAGMVCAELGNSRRAESLLREYLRQPEGAASARAEALDGLSRLSLFHDRPDLLDEADTWSRDAVDLMPDVLALMATRGAILVQLGRADDGVKLLRNVVRRSGATLDRAISVAFLAKACAATGDKVEFERWVSQARALEGAHPVVKRITRDLNTRH